MGTMITGPSTNPGLTQLNQAFGNIYGMLGGGGGLSGGGQGPFGGAPQPVSGADNSLTAQQRGTANLAGQAAPTAFGLGTGMLGTGLGITQGGLNVMGEGLGTTETGLGTMQGAIDFYSKLASGDPGAMTQALSPTSGNISTIATGLTDQLSRGGIRGGNTATALGNLPFAQLAQINNAALQLQPQAAAALGQLGTAQANIGAQQGQMGLGAAGIGTTISGQGTTLTGQGLQGLINLYNSLIQKQNINQQATPLTAFDQFASGVANLAGAAGGVMTGIGNMGGANAPRGTGGGTP